MLTLQILRRAQSWVCQSASHLPIFLATTVAQAIDSSEEPSRSLCDSVLSRRDPFFFRVRSCTPPANSLRNTVNIIHAHLAFIYS